MNEFLGALPKYQIQHWLEKNLPDETKIEFQNILETLHESEAGMSQLEDFVNRNPDFLEAAVTLAQYKIISDPAAAIQIVEQVRPGNQFYDYAEDIRLLAQLADFDSDETEGVAFKLKTAREAMLANDWEATLNYLVESVMIDKAYQEEFPRRASIAAFRYFGRTT